MKKVFVRTIALLVCLMVMISFPAYAETGNETPGDDTPTIQPRWTEISIFGCSMERRNGLFTNAHTLASVTTYSVYSQITLTVTLQQHDGSSFADTSTTWSFSGNGYAGGPKDLNLSSGSYRIKAVAVIYSSSGKYIETVTNYSADIIIP